MNVYLKGKKIKVNPSKSIGKGGEADIYDIGSGLVLKLFKQSDHPDLNGFPQDQQAAIDRLNEHQKKLPAFPKNLPAKVISPVDLATNSKGSAIIGYTMKFFKGYEVLLKYADKSYRNTGISNELVLATFRDLHSTVKGIHGAGVTIGDFNDLNILVSKGEAYIIDADSFQYGGFLCRVFTEKFVDPILCDQNNTHPILVNPFNADSDWYAYAIMLMQSILFVGPYGGIYKPKNKKDRINHAARPLKRITIFNPEVKYPKPAVPYGVLPDDLLQSFHQIFDEDRRKEFPIEVLNKMRWTTCSDCGTIHARNVCPGCSKHSPSVVKETIRGSVTCTRIFQTSGSILFATIAGNKLQYLYYENGTFKREGGAEIVKGNLHPTMRFRIKGRETLIGDSGQFISLVPGRKPERIVVDSLRALPLFDSNNNYKYWACDGQLMRSDVLGPKYIGDVLKDQTLFWVGNDFGFGFYRAGNINVGFVFDAKNGGINDSVKIPVISGQLIDATCYFAGNWCWFLISSRDRGKTINRCMVIKSDGVVGEFAEAKEGDGSWLGSIRGKCAAGKFLLAATDDGIVRVEPSGGTIAVVKEFPDTEPFVDSGCHLYPDSNGLYVVSRKRVKLLKIS
jgi:H/ACA ribonucleoprotein complex subunit 3